MKIIFCWHSPVGSLTVTIIENDYIYNVFNAE